MRKFLSEDEVRAIVNAPDDPLRVWFDLEGQTVDALELVLEHLQRVPARPASWKWVLIGIHAALQGCFGLALARTDGAQLLIPEQEQQYWKHVNHWRETGSWEPRGYVTKKGEPQDPKVDWFLNLFEKVQDPERMRYMGGVPLKPTAEQIEHIEYLNANRGILSHFSDTTLALNVASMLKDIETGLTFADILLTKTQYMAEDVPFGPINTIHDAALADETANVIRAIGVELTEVRKRYGLTEASASRSGN